MFAFHGYSYEKKSPRQHDLMKRIVKDTEANMTASREIKARQKGSGTDPLEAIKTPERTCMTPSHSLFVRSKPFLPRSTNVPRSQNTSPGVLVCLVLNLGGEHERVSRLASWVPSGVHTWASGARRRGFRARWRLISRFEGWEDDAPSGTWVSLDPSCH